MIGAACDLRKNVFASERRRPVKMNESVTTIVIDTTLFVSPDVSLSSSRLCLHLPAMREKIIKGHAPDARDGKAVT